MVISHRGSVVTDTEQFVFSNPGYFGLTFTCILIFIA